MLLARLDQIPERPPTLTIAHQPRQGAIGPHMQRIQCQNRTQGRFGLALAIGLALLDLSDEHEDFLPQGWLLGTSQHPLRGLRESGQLARVCPELLAHRRITRLHLEHPQHGKKSGCRIGQRALIQIGQQLQMHPPRVPVHGCRNQRLEYPRPLVEAFGQLVVRQQPACHLGNVFPANHARGEQPLQPLNRLGRDGVSLQHLQVRVGGRCRLSQRSLQQPRHAQENRGPLCFGARTRLTGERLDQTFYVPHRIQDARQLTQEAHVSGLDVAGLTQHGRRGGGVTQTLLLHVRNTQQEIGAQGRILHARLAPMLQGNQIGPALALRVELEQSILGVVVARLKGQDALGESLEIIRTIHPLTGNEQAPAQKGKLLLRARPPFALAVQPGRQQAKQRLPLFGRFAHAFQVGAHVGIGGGQAVGPGAPLEG